MKKLKWYFKNGESYETYTVLYETDGWLLVKNNNTKEYSFGLARDFGTLLGFPVNQSCLPFEKAKAQLNAFVAIDEKYLPTLGDIARNNIKRWKDMISALDNDLNKKKWIQIWYSWGDQESSIEVPEGTDAWEYMKSLAVNEAEIAFSSHEDEGEIGLQFFVGEEKIVLHYPYDDEYCYYLITDTEDYDPNNN